MFLHTFRKTIALKARRKRFSILLSKIENLKKPVKILDIGGTVKFWEDMNFTPGIDYYITLLNLTFPSSESSNYTKIIGSATDLKQFKDQSFDVVFSNSVIEHLFSWDNQMKMANEIKRVAKNYFIQTPNYYFPLEPHFNTIGFQYLSRALKIKLLTNIDLGHYTGLRNYNDAANVIDEIKLLRKKQMKKLFSEAEIHCEKMFGLNKSIIAIHFNSKIQ